MRTINLKFTNKYSFKYSILISLHYFELNTHKERINPLNKYFNKYIFNSNNYADFETNSPSISRTVYDENGKFLHKPESNTNNNAYIVKLNNNRYHALKPNKDKYKQLNDLLKQFTPKELSEYILNKVTC